MHLRLRALLFVEAIHQLLVLAIHLPQLPADLVTLLPRGFRAEFAAFGA